jgi:hypothetical protein
VDTAHSPTPSPESFFRTWGNAPLKFKIIDVGIQIFVASPGQIDDHNIGWFELYFV